MGKRLLITIVSTVLGLAVIGAAVPLAVHAAGGGEAGTRAPLVQAAGPGLHGGGGGDQGG